MAPASHPVHSNTVALPPSHGGARSQPPQSGARQTNKASSTPRRRPILQDRAALQLAEKPSRFSGMMVRSFVQHFSASRFPPADDRARPRKAGMSQAFTELVAGGFEVHFSAPFAAVSRGHQ